MEKAGAISSRITSAVFKKLKISPIKALYKYYTPTNTNLAGGIPIESCFPFQSINVTLGNGQTPDDSYLMTKGKDLHLNYQMGEGLPALVQWTKSHVAEIHNPPFDYKVAMTIGSTHAWFQILQLLNSNCILFDQYVYGASVTPVNTMGKNAIGVASDEHGMMPDAIRESVLLARSKGLVVDMLYLIPVGHNPMGTTIPFERKKEIYAVCQELDLIIVEDGKTIDVQCCYAHFKSFNFSSSLFVFDRFLQMRTTICTIQTTNQTFLAQENCPSKNDKRCFLPFNCVLIILGGTFCVRSLLSIDVDGRVIRIDTVSKIISPGMRLGWVTGPPDFIDKYVLLQSQSAQFPCSISQSMFLGLVNHWGEPGLHQHLQNVSLVAIVLLFHRTCPPFCLFLDSCLLLLGVQTIGLIYLMLLRLPVAPAPLSDAARPVCSQCGGVLRAGTGAVLCSHGGHVLLAHLPHAAQLDHPPAVRGLRKGGRNYRSRHEFLCAQPGRAGADRRPGP
jgi:aromatic amino acid aminotransferase I / 2-aminoadipate transaminase